MKNKHTRRGFTQIKWVGQALPDNAPAKGHLAAFTLIELLVVVLIIGILAAVAVPQYQKAVYKSRATEALTMLKAIGNAQEVYYLANDSYTDDITQLDVEVPSELITTAAGGRLENKYMYYCTTTYCEASANNANMPNFETHVKHKQANTAGKFYCHLTSGDSKNDTAKSICQSLGTVDTSDNASWFAGKYFVIN